MRVFRLEELAFMEIFIVCVLLLASSIFTIIFYKIKLNLKFIALVLITGLVLCLLSSLVIWNGRSGEYFTNKFGWPRVYYSQNWAIEASDLNYFEPTRFVTNLGTWILMSANLHLLVEIIRNKKKSINKIVIVTGIILVLLVLVLWSLFNSYMNWYAPPYFFSNFFIDTMR